MTRKPGPGEPNYDFSSFKPDISTLFSSFYKQLEGLDKSKEQRYKAVMHHALSNLPDDVTSLVYIHRLLGAAYAVLAHDKLEALIQGLPEHLGKDRPIRFCSVACGYALELYAIDYLCRQYQLTYEFVGVDIKRSDMAECSAAYDALPAKFVVADATNYPAVNNALKSQNVDLSLGFDVMLLLQPNIGGASGLQEAFIQIIQNIVPRLANPLAAFYTSTYLEEEMMRVLQALYDRKDQHDSQANVYSCVAELQECNSQDWLRSLKIEKKALKFPIAPAVNTAGSGEIIGVTPLSFEFVTAMNGLCLCSDNKAGQSYESVLNEVSLRLYKAGYYREAIYCFEWLLKHGSLDDDVESRLMFNLGRSYCRIKEFAEAKRYLSDAADGVTDLGKKVYYQACVTETEGFEAFARGYYVEAVYLLKSAEKKFLELRKPGSRCDEINTTIGECEKRIIEFSGPRLCAPPVSDCSDEGYGLKLGSS